MTLNKKYDISDEIMEIEKIIPYEKNPRNNSQAIQPVKNSIEQFGFVNPIILDHDHVIIAGHTRYCAAKELGLEKVPVRVMNGLTESEVKAFRIADNKTAEYAEWNTDFLVQELKEIEAMEFDLSATGMSTKEIDELLKSYEPLPENFLGDFDNQELDASDFEESEFDCQCPKCGFLFNKEDC